jgi:cyclopropane-fatty-acyl-phospholipid synthase
MKFSIKKFIFCFLIIIVFLIVGRGIFMSHPETVIKKLLAEADININGDHASDIIVYNDKLYARVLGQGSLGLGQSYMDGCWDCNALDEFFFKLFRADIQNKIRHNLNTIFAYFKSIVINLQSKDRAFQVGQQHYDLGDDLFKAMLDKRMIYSCAYWKNAHNLDQAQENKLELICKKLQLKPGMKLLDIGCGWGGLALYAAQKYGVAVVGVTISKEQAKYAQEITKNYPVEIRLQDYRDLDEQFDRIVSVGMFEHVGYKNYQTFIDICHKLLNDDGLFLLHTIGSNQSWTTGDDWLNKYIFTNGMLPSIAQIAKAIEGKFVMEDWHNFGADYDKTLMAWYENFERNWSQLQSKYTERFKRMWDYYLLSCAGLFRARYIQLWQIVFSKNGVIGGYQSVR